MKKKLLRPLIPLAGFFLGALVCFLGIKYAWGNADIFPRNGAWRYAADMDLAKSDYQRAIIARSGLFALRESEVLYYFLTEDEDGEALRSDRVYQLEGLNFDARYWSYTLYGADDFLIPNAENRYGLNQENMIYEDSTRQRYQFRISSKAQSGNWIPAGEAQDMSLLLRLYNPAPEIYKRVGDLSLPEIKTLDSHE